MRVWVDLTNSPHVLVMRPIVRALEQRGAEVLVTARDFAQTLDLCERHGLACEAIGRHRGGRLAAKGVGPAVALDGAAALGARAEDRHRARPRLQRRHRRGAAARHPQLDGLRLRVGEGPAQRQLPAGEGDRRAGGDPARPPAAVRRHRGQAPPVSGPEGGVLPGRLRARPGGARRAGDRSRRAADRRRPHPARRLALPPLREPAVRERAQPAQARPDRGAPAHARNSAPSSATSSCPSARSTPSR